MNFGFGNTFCAGIAVRQEYHALAAKTTRVAGVMMPTVHKEMQFSLDPIDDGI